MRQSAVIALLAAPALAMALTVRAEPAVDQANYPLANSDGNLEIHEANTDPEGGRHFVAQTFTVGKTGLLTRVELPVKHHRCTPVGQLHVDILWTVNGVPGDVALGRASVGPADVPATEYGLVAFEFGVNAPQVVVGDMLTIAVTTDAMYPCNYAWDGEFNGEFNEFNSDYAGGATWCFYQLEFMTDACWRDMGFRTWVAERLTEDPPPDDPPPPPPPPPPPDDDDQGENDDDQGDNDDGQGGDQDATGDRGKSAQAPFAGSMQWTGLLLLLLGAGLRRRKAR